MIELSLIFIFQQHWEFYVKAVFYLSCYVVENNYCFSNPRIKIIRSRGYVVMNETLDLAKVSESDHLVFYGALFAIAFVDNSIDKEEV